MRIDTRPIRPDRLIETPRLLLRIPRPTDLPLLQARIFSDAEVMRHVDAGAVLTPKRSAEFVAATLDHEGSGRRPGVLIEKATGEVVGYAGPMRCRVLGDEDLEIGFVLARFAWGKGYGTEIGRGQLAHAFDTLGCTRVLALAAPGNAGSIATILRIDMRFHRVADVPGRGMRNVYISLRD